MENKTAYKVLKDWGNFKEGEMFVASEMTDITETQFRQLVEDGTIELVEDVALVDYKVISPEGITFEGDDHAVVEGVIFASLSDNPEIVAFLSAGKIEVATQEDLDAQLVAAAEASAAEQDASQTASASDEKHFVKKYNGQAVVSDGFSTINDVQYHHVRIADGTEYDLNDADYAEYVNEA